MKAARITAALGALLCILGWFLWWGPEHMGYSLLAVGLHTIWSAPPHGYVWLAVGALLTLFGGLSLGAGLGVIRALHAEKLRRAGVHGLLLLGWLGLFAVFEPRDELGYGIGILLTLVGASVGGVAAVVVWVLGRARVPGTLPASVVKLRTGATGLLVVEDLDVHYGAVHALKGISLAVSEGEIVTLLGGNGAGKTTTLRALSGLVGPTRGTVSLDGRVIASTQARATPDAIVGLGVAHAPEGRGIFANLTVRENLDLGAYQRRDRAGIARDLEQALGRFPRLRERLTQRAGTLSGGEQQMLAIGRALMARPRLLLLDEPSLGLAPTIVKVIFDIIQDINHSGTTILLVEQNAHQALKVATKGYVLETGAIVMSDSAAALAASDEVRKAYLGVG